MDESPDRKSFPLRLPRKLFDDMQRWARDDLRSLNAQIEFVLREALRRRGWVVGKSDEDEQEPASGSDVE